MIKDCKLITSKDNKIYKELLKIKDGKSEDSLLLASGEDLFTEAKKNDSLIKCILPIDSSFDTEGFDTIYLKNELYRALTNYSSLPKVISVCKKEYSKIEELGDKVIYLDGIQDPGNCGTIIRTALSFSYSSLVLSSDCVSIYNDKVIQSSKGALFKLKIAKADLSLLKEKGYNIYLTTLDGIDERSIERLSKPFVLVFGNEGHGVRDKNKSLGVNIRIDMSSIDSLNVAVAAGIFMYRFK